MSSHGLTRNPQSHARGSAKTQVDTWMEKKSGAKKTPNYWGGLGGLLGLLDSLKLI